MIILRELHEKDAEYMLEWMHDADIQKGFQKNMMDMKIEDVLAFCQQAKITDEIADGQSIHYAIVDDNDDEYLGTISLKDISTKNMTAEYAISTRKKAHGRGIAKAATGLILKKAFFDYNLNRVYLNVLSDNIAAIKLYEKCGFRFEGEFREHLIINGKIASWKWYAMLKREFDNNIFKENI